MLPDFEDPRVEKPSDRQFEFAITDLLGKVTQGTKFATGMVRAYSMMIIETRITANALHISHAYEAMLKRVGGKNLRRFSTNEKHYIYRALHKLQQAKNAQVDTMEISRLADTQSENHQPSAPPSGA